MGIKDHELFQTWCSMRKRCSNPNASGYERYGGAGIVVCDRWRQSFENFVEDMGRRPRGHTLDRIDAAGNYEPGNCRWATASQQSLNRRPSTKPRKATVPKGTIRECYEWSSDPRKCKYRWVRDEPVTPTV